VDEVEQGHSTTVEHTPCRNGDGSGPDVCRGVENGGRPALAPRPATQPASRAGAAARRRDRQAP
jgi:hypothetical protein